MQLAENRAAERRIIRALKANPAIADVKRRTSKVHLSHDGVFLAGIFFPATVEFIRTSFLNYWKKYSLRLSKETLFTGEQDGDIVFWRTQAHHGTYNASLIMEKVDFSVAGCGANRL
ncbi:MAG: hypothetical protein WC047_01225 [Kiritimatiellales bacterium]